MKAEPATDLLSTAVAWTDAKGMILGVNPAFARWMGVSARRLLGQSLAIMETDGDAMTRLFSNSAPLKALNQGSLQNKRLKVINEDAGQWLETARQSFDAIIIDLPDPTEEEVRFGLAGNLCRCTGYDKIVRAVLETAADMRESAR